MFPSPIQKHGMFANVSYRVALYVSLLLWILPLIAILFTSVRSSADINKGNYWGVPSELNIVENYTNVFTNTPMLRYFINSLIITIPTVIVTIFISSLAGYALAFHIFRGRLLLFSLFIAGNFIPFQILMIPVRDFSIRMGTYDSPISLILFHIAFQSGFATFFLRNFIKTIPFSLIESARMEGAGEWRIFFKIIFPLSKPTLSALSVLIFTFVWNDFFWALTLVQSDKVRPVTVGIQALRGQWIASWNLIAAGSVVAALPPVIMFFLMQKQFISGLTMGSVKGE